MPWQCSICGGFSAQNRSQLLNHIGRCHRNDPNFHCMCGIEGCTRTFKKYYTWRKHLTERHAEVPCNQNDHEIHIENENNQHEDEPMEENGENNTRSAALYILKIQEDLLLPRSTVQNIIANTKTFLHNTLSIVESQVKDCLNNANMEYQNVPGLQEIFDESNPTTNPFRNLETESQQWRYYKEYFGLKEPRRIILGQKQVYRRRDGVLQPTEANDEACYIPLLDSLQQLLNDDFILAEISNPHTSSDGLLRDYCDGDQFKMHRLFSLKPTALQIMLYYDDLETCNPLGSRATIHKLGAFYYTLGNINPLNRSSMKAIQLLCLCTTSNIKEYGIDAVLKPFMTDLKKLEEPNGHPFTINGSEENITGSIAYTSADNLGAQLLGGFKESCSANKPCRYCLATAEEMKSKFHEKEFVLRTKESYNIQADQVQKYGEHFSKTYGINRKSILTESNYYHVVDGLPPDIMHDILEGVLQYETKEMLKNFIKVEHYLTLKILNDRIAKYDFGYYNDTNKPSPITEAKFSSNDNSLKQHAVQMWCLATHIPLIIGDLIPLENARWILYLKLLEIISLCFAPVISKDQVAYLQVLINDHHHKFRELYPECSIIPKMHFMVHMPTATMRMGPLVRAWCMRFEAKHHYFKKLSTVIGNYTNLPFTLAMRHQQWLCYQLQSANHESGFLEKGVEVGPGSTFCAGDLDYYNLLEEQEFGIDQTTNVTKIKWISVQGIIFKVGCVLWIGHDDEETPCFVVLKEICIIERNLEKILFITDILCTVLFNGHLNAYEVNNTARSKIIEQKQPLYPFPLHLVNAVFQGYAKMFVCPKYQMPVT